LAGCGMKKDTANPSQNQKTEQKNEQKTEQASQPKSNNQYKAPDNNQKFDFVTVCEGKSEGDSCEIAAPGPSQTNQKVVGTCKKQTRLDTKEEVMACTPNDMPQGGPGGPGRPNGNKQ
jgi:hypothetical protein